jgi:hypothetical protein
MVRFFDGSDPILSWWTAIVVLLVVSVVVYVLLRQIITAAVAIENTVSEIWTKGQRVANNTIHIAGLYRTNDLVEGILGRAARIAASAAAIEQHAKTCPGCPACIVSKR